MFKVTARHIQHYSICYNAYFYMHTQRNEKQKEKAKYRMFSFWKGRKILAPF